MKGYVFKRTANTSFYKDSADATSASKSTTLLPKIDHSKHIPKFVLERASRKAKRDILPVFTKTWRLNRIEGISIIIFQPVLTVLYRPFCIPSFVKLKCRYLAYAACKIVTISNKLKTFDTIVRKHHQNLCLPKFFNFLYSQTQSNFPQSNLNSVRQSGNINWSPESRNKYRTIEEGITNNYNTYFSSKAKEPLNFQNTSRGEDCSATSSQSVNGFFHDTFTLKTPSSVER